MSLCLRHQNVCRDICHHGRSLLIVTITLVGFLLPPGIRPKIKNAMFIRHKRFVCHSAVLTSQVNNTVGVAWSSPLTHIVGQSMAFSVLETLDPILVLGLLPEHKYINLVCLCRAQTIDNSDFVCMHKL